MLRVLQEREVQRVGDEKIIKVDCRVIAATNKNLQQAIRNGTFREDLYYRLNAALITVPPLRERVSDIPLLVNHFVRKYSPGSSAGKAQPSGVSKEALEILMNYSFPGNIRELENCMERAVILAGSGKIKPEHLPGHIVGDSASSRVPPSRNVKIDELHAAMGAITLNEKSASGDGWAKAMKVATVEDLCRFLAGMEGGEFTRKEFENFLSVLGRNDKSRSRYATAGRYLKILREKGILEHNGEKANKVRFRLSKAFITES